MRLHRPSFYSYRCATDQVRGGLNRYGLRVIGVYFKHGGVAYCVKWASV